MAGITTTEDIKQLGTILCVWAHPDDETFCCAGIMAAAIRNGQTVACITATKGELGVRDSTRWPADKLGSIRELEMKRALDCIGCQNHDWLGYRDGGCSEIADSDGADSVARFIDRYQPNTILTFGSDGLTGHSDHRAVSRWVDLAANDEVRVFHVVAEDSIYTKYLKEADEKLDIFFSIDKPPTFVDQDCDIAFKLTPELSKIKEQALRSMPSQYEQFLDGLSDEFVQEVFSLECFVEASK